MDLRPIGIVRCEFPEKFGVPKQPGLVAGLRATLEFAGEYGHETYWRGIEHCSHLWVIFAFHLNRPHSGGTVRPPVLGGQERMGVFATRSPHRPNPLGLSVVKIEGWSRHDGVFKLEVSGHDFVEGTPVLDVKPYVAAYDLPSEETRHWSAGATAAPLPVSWESAAWDACPAEWRETLAQIISLDPRPRGGARPQGPFGMAFRGYNVRFVEDLAGLRVTSVASGGSRY